jgi:hypothetical protein
MHVSARRRQARRRLVAADLPPVAIEAWARALASDERPHDQPEVQALAPVQFDAIEMLASGGSFRIWTDDEIAALWEAHRGRFVAAWIRHLPGRRPSAWWRFDSPDEDLRTVKAAERFQLPEWEEESTYLRRHHLLTKAEDAALRRLPKRKTADEIEAEQAALDAAIIAKLEEEVAVDAELDGRADRGDS